MRTQPKLKLAKSGVYEIRWSEAREGGWRSRKKSTGTSDYTIAVAKLSEFLTIRPIEERTYTVAQAFDAYCRYHVADARSEATARMTMRAPLGAFGDWPLTAITNLDIEQYTSQRLNGKHGTRSVKPATVRREIVSLQAVLNFASSRGMVRGEKVYKLPKPSDGPPRDKWITEEQQDEILGKLRDAPVDVRAFTQLALTYGVRAGAIVDLRFGEQVDFINGVIDFNVPGRRATRKRRPRVPMTATVRKTLSEIFQDNARAGARVVLPSTPDRYRKFMESIGYDWVTPHVLKHSAITLMLRAGVPDGDVAKLTATDLRTIHRVYRHHTMSELASIAESRGI